MPIKIDGRRNNGGHPNMGRKRLPTLAIQPRVMPETDVYLQSQISSAAKTKGQVIDLMAEFCKAKGFTTG